MGFEASSYVWECKTGIGGEVTLLEWLVSFGYTVCNVPFNGYMIDRYGRSKTIHKFLQKLPHLRQVTRIALWTETLSGAW